MSRRVVPVPPHLAAPMREHLSPLAPDGVVFPAPGGGAWDDRNWSRRVFDPAVAAAGVPRGTPHDMRHTAASWLVQAGVDLYVVQQMLGHESFRTTQRYAHLAPDAFEKVIDAWEDMERDDE
jgi:site-specific recombinase XerD